MTELIATINGSSLDSTSYVEKEKSAVEVGRRLLGTNSVSFQELINSDMATLMSNCLFSPTVELDRPISTFASGVMLSQSLLPTNSFRTANSNSLYWSLSSPNTALLIPDPMFFGSPTLGDTATIALPYRRYPSIPRAACFGYACDCCRQPLEPVSYNIFFSSATNSVAVPLPVGFPCVITSFDNSYLSNLIQFIPSYLLTNKVESGLTLQFLLCKRGTSTWQSSSCVRHLSTFLNLGPCTCHLSVHLITSSHRNLSLSIFSNKK